MGAGGSKTEIRDCSTDYLDFDNLVLLDYYADYYIDYSTGCQYPVRPRPTYPARPITTPTTTTAFPSTTDWVQTTGADEFFWYTTIATSPSVYIQTQNPLFDWFQTTGADESLFYTTRAYPYTSDADGNVLATTVAYQEFEEKYRGTTMENTEAEFDTIQTTTDQKQKAPIECKDNIYYNCAAELARNPQHCTDPEWGEIMQLLCKKTCGFCN